MKVSFQLLVAGSYALDYRIDLLHNKSSKLGSVRLNENK